jgi:predicted transcriptional regulator
MVTKALWLDLRREWEDNPKMTMAEVAKRLGVSQAAVAKHVKKEGWAKVVVTDIDRVVYSPRQLAEIAIRSLVRAATQTQDPAAAVKAAMALLDRTMGRVVAEQTMPLIPPDIDAESQQWPEWLKARRLAYQEGAQADDGFEPPADQPQQALEPSNEPAPPQPTCPPPETPTAPFRPLHLVQHAAPAFYDRPDLPASGPTRDPSRH